MEEPLLKVDHLVKYFPVYDRGILLKRKIGDVHAVDDISISVQRGETLGLVGESGCGKTTAGKTLMNLEEPNSGSVFFEGKDLYKTLRAGKSEEARYLRRNIQMVFQNPYG